MAWTETARRDYARRGLRYASDCTDDEWAVVAPLLQPMGKVGRPREHDPRILWNAIQYIEVAREICTARISGISA
ncbi:hypothetical protein CQ057_03020 [Ochrobactrum sp. MYb49]|nr:hypothetical protein CQ057_03020 [Ochrobactrum sp. MYb49]